MSRVAFFAWSALALAGAAACAHTAPLPPQVVAVMPVDVLGVEPERGIALRQAVEAAASDLSSVTIVPPVDVDRALADHTPAGSACLEADACLAALGSTLAAPSVLALTLAGLGETSIVRSRLVSAEQGLTLQDLQETVVGGPDAVRIYAGELTRRLFPEAPPPWYRRGWVWAGSATVLALGTTLAVVLVSGRQHDSGVVHIGDL